MDTRQMLRRAACVSWLCVLVAAASGCGGGVESNDDLSPAPPDPDVAPASPTSSTGHLTVNVSTDDGDVLANASITLDIGAGTSRHAATGSDGSATFDSLPASVRMTVAHPLAAYASRVAIAQQGETNLVLSLKPRIPRPAVALLPVAVAPGSVSADRRELTLQLRLVSAPDAPFIAAGQRSTHATPYLALNFEGDTWFDDRACIVFTSLEHPVATCSSYGDSPYAVTVDAFDYDPAGTIPLPASPGSSVSAMLLMDQSQRISSWDSLDFRSFAARRLIRRLLRSATSKSLSIAGFAGNGSSSTTPTLPAIPIWLPRGSGAAFTSDLTALQSDIGILEPLTGGRAPVFAALDSAMNITASEAPPGTRTVIAMLGGGDDGSSSEGDRVMALTALRRQQNDTGVRSILISATDTEFLAGRNDIADLAEALRAPVLATDTVYYDVQSQIWPSATYAAFDLAADLIEGTRLPTLSATFRVRAPSAGAFATGAMLRGVVYVQSELCPFDCEEVRLAFAVRIP